MELECGVKCVDDAISRLTDPVRRQWACTSRCILRNYIERKDEEGLWTLAKQSKDKSVSSYYVKDLKKFFAKGQAYFPYRPETVMKFYCKMSNKLLFDSHFLTGKQIDVIRDSEFDVQFSVIWMQREAHGSFKSRDAVMAVLTFQVGEVLYQIAHSIDHPLFPEQKSPVRAKVDFCINEARPHPKGKGTLFTRMCKADPNGDVPPLYKEKLIEQAGMDLIKLRKAMSQ